MPGRLDTPRSALNFPRGYQKPPNPVLDASHPLTRGRSVYVPLGDSVSNSVREVVGGLNGTINTGPLAFSSSHHGGMATSFSGSFQYISVPVPASHQSLSYGTWAAWIKTSSLSGGYPMILSRASATSTNGVSLFLDGSTAQLRGQIKGGGGVVDIQGGASLIDGKWHHVVMTFSPNGGPATLYVDGVNVASANASGAWSFASNPFLIAGSQDTFWRYFLGSIEGVSLFDRVLSATEVRALYAEPYIGIYTRGMRASSLSATIYTLVASFGSLSLTGQNVGLLRSLLLPAAQGTFTLTGKAAGLYRLFTLLAAQGTYALTGKVANLLRNRVLPAAQGTFTLTGKAANLLRNLLLSAGQGSFGLVGKAAILTYNSLTATYTLVAAFGTFVLSGQAARLLKNAVMPSAQGTFTLTGKAAGLFKNRTLLAAQGNFVLAGQNAGLLASRILTAVRGLFALSGQTAGLYKNRVLTAAQGTFTLTGKAAIFARAYTLSAATGIFSLAGQLANLFVVNAHFGLSPKFVFTALSRLKSFTAKVRSRKFTPEG